MKYRAVIADDEAKIIRLIEELGQWGLLGIEIVDTCTTGSAALESILRLRPDFVLSDIKMPGLDGLELIQRVRDAGAAPLFILISGYRHFEYARTAVSLGVMDYLLNCKLLIMDEPTASIPMAEVSNLFRIVRRLKEKGVSIIYISHRLEELFELCDRVTVFRDGRFVVTRNVAEITKKDLIRYMIGRELTEKFPERNVKIGEPVLEVRDLTGNGDFHINLRLHRGEILGLAGLVGAGRTELAKMICGDVKPESGEILVRSKKMRASSVADMVDHGIGLIPEDRKQEGAFLQYSIEWNIPVISLRKNSTYGFMHFKVLDKLVDSFTHMLDIKTPTVKQLVRNLSGGNQQKVVVAKVLAAQNDILIFDEPTRGIDVGAKQEIYKLMNQLVESGKSILMISSEMEEMLGMSDRIIVLHEGRVSGEIVKQDFSQERVLELASGFVEGA